MVRHREFGRRSFAREPRAENWAQAGAGEALVSRSASRRGGPAAARLRRIRAGPRSRRRPRPCLLDTAGRKYWDGDTVTVRISRLPQARSRR